MKFFLFLCLFLFLFPIVGRFVLRSVLWMLGVSAVKLAQREFNQAQREASSPKGTPPNGARGKQTGPRREGVIDIDYIPEPDDNKKRRGTDFKGGDYVDYEEVK